MDYDFNIDIHCHASWKPFMSGRNNAVHTPFETYTNEIEAWWIKKLSRQIENKLRLRLGTQSNFDNLHKGKVRVAIVALTILEKAFLVANLKADDFFTFALKELVSEKKTPWDYTLKSRLINAITGFHLDDIEYIKKELQQYFQEGLVPEYHYFTQFNLKQNKEETYTIQFVKNYREIEEAVRPGKTTICIIISIEGAHALSSHAPDITFLKNNQGRSHQNDEADFTSLAAYANNITEMKKWDFVPLYISLNHHFWNGLGGHAKSLTKPVAHIVCQAEGLNEGLKALGKEVIRLLLTTDNGPRVLLDIKHMSPQCRKDFYAFIQSEYWNHHDRFPLLCSHTGMVSKSRTLDALIAQDDEAELNSNSNYLHEHSINLCAEDIMMIAETRGLIGIQLDEKRIAGNNIINIVKNNPKLNGIHLRRQYIKVLFANLFEIVKTVNSKQGWDLLSIGSDYDGFIQYMEFYPSTAEIPVLRNDMLEFLNNPEEISQPGFNYTLLLPEINRLMFGLSPKEILDKIFAANVMAFLQNNFNR